MRKLKRNLVIVTVLFFVCAAVYLNWSYNNRWGEVDDAMVKAEDDAMANAQLNEGDSQISVISGYFADARLTRQQSRDEALQLLQMAASSENASAEVIDSAMNEISVMAQYTMNETQLENELIARNFADCVVFMRDDGVTVTVPAPAEGLDAASVAKITEAITTGTQYKVEQIKVVEVKTGMTAGDSGLAQTGTILPETDGAALDTVLDAAAPEGDPVD